MSDDRIYRITLVRHGESVGNAEERVQGHADYPLSERGRAQIRALAARWQDEGVTFDHVVTSPLRRALETARILAADLRIAEPEIDGCWIEQDAGGNAGVRWDEIERVGASHGGPSSRRPIGPWVETDDALHERAAEALRSIQQRAAGRYLVISHRALLNAVLFAVLGSAPPGAGRRASFRIRNGSFSRVRYDPVERTWQIDVIGDRAHWPSTR